MKTLAVIFALVALSSGFKIETKKAQLITQPKNNQCGDDETTCPNGCCPVPPELNWWCCEDYCAATAADCPFVAKQVRLMELAKNKQCGPDETSCPGGCCPYENWFCCPDAYYCAATAADCPFVAKTVSLVKLAKSTQCGPDQTDCGPSGCCPEANWFCCPDPGSYSCAATPADCP